MKREQHKDWKKRWFKRYGEADGFTRRGKKGQMDSRDRKIYRWILPVLAERISEHTCGTFAGPLSTLMWFCP